MNTPIPQAMSTPTNHSSHHANGGPAFPQSFLGEGIVSGMTLRDYFAGQALCAAWRDLARTEDQSIYMDIAGRKLKPGDDVYTAPVYVADLAYQYADALIAAREAKP